MEMVQECILQRQTPISSCSFVSGECSSSAVPPPLLLLLSMERADHRRSPSACSSLPVFQKLHTLTGKPVSVTTLRLVLHTLSLPNEYPKLTAWACGFKKQAWNMSVLPSSCSSSKMLLRIPPYMKPS